MRTSGGERGTQRIRHTEHTAEGIRDVQMASCVCVRATDQIGTNYIFSNFFLSLDTIGICNLILGVFSSTVFFFLHSRLAQTTLARIGVWILFFADYLWLRLWHTDICASCDCECWRVTECECVWGSERRAIHDAQVLGCSHLCCARETHDQ